VTSHQRQVPGMVHASATRSDIPRKQRLSNSHIRIKKPYSKVGYDVHGTHMPMPQQWVDSKI